MVFSKSLLSSLVVAAVLFCIEAHPGALKCFTDAQTASLSNDVIRTGAVMMNLKVTAPPSGANVTLSVFDSLEASKKKGTGVSKFVPGQKYYVGLSGVPEGAYYAIRASNNLGVFTPSNATTQATTVNCAGQLISKAGVGSDGAAGAFWTAPASGEVADAALTFSAVWSLGPGITLPPSKSPGVFFVETAISALPSATSSGEMGTTGVQVAVGVDDEFKKALIYLSGPSDSWYAVGFGDVTMKGYAIIVDETGAVHERFMEGIGNVGADDLVPMVTVVSTAVDSGTKVRSVVLERSSAGASRDYFTFSIGSSGIKAVAAKGASAWNGGKSYHSAKFKGTLKTATTTPPVPFNSAPYWKAHGILMTLSWAVFAPIGIYMARAKSQFSKSWFPVHRAVQVLAVLSTAAGFALAVYATKRTSSPHFNILHAKIGLAVTCAALLQPLNAFIRPHATKDGALKSMKRSMWEFFHKKLGYGALLAAWFNMLLAFDQDFCSSISGVLRVIAGVGIGAFCIATIHTATREAKAAATDGLPTYDENGYSETAYHEKLLSPS